MSIKLPNLVTMLRSRGASDEVAARRGSLALSCINPTSMRAYINHTDVECVEFRPPYARYRLMCDARREGGCVLDIEGACVYG